MQGGFPVIGEITPCHTFTKEINHASARSQYLNENFCCKNYLLVYSAMTGNPALFLFPSICLQGIRKIERFKLYTVL